MDKLDRATLPIGEVARSAGVTVSAVRYYDEIGVISASTRVGGKRRFDPEAVGRVSFIKRCQQAGLSLEEIRTILDEQRDSWQALVEAKLAKLHERRANLDSMIELLTEFRDCGCKAVAKCPKVELS
ncbi:MAG: MerR family transcriptional regulator [Gaiellaceae bacterium]